MRAADSRPFFCSSRTASSERIVSAAPLVATSFAVSVSTLMTMFSVVPSRASRHWHPWSRAGAFYAIRKRGDHGPELLEARDRRRTGAQQLDILFRDGEPSTVDAFTYINSSGNRDQAIRRVKLNKKGSGRVRTK